VAQLLLVSLCLGRSPWRRGIAAPPPLSTSWASAPLAAFQTSINGRFWVSTEGERALTLWKSVGDTIRAWLAVRGAAAAPELFLNAWGMAMTRSGFERVLQKHVAAASAACPSLRDKRVSPHVLRHTCALRTLQATRDLRKVALWLGHASTQTTDVYLQADPTEKLEALAAMKPPALRPGKFRPPDRLIAALRVSAVMRRPAGQNP